MPPRPLDETTPVIVGAARITQRPPPNLRDAKSPLDLLLDAVRGAAADTGLAAEGQAAALRATGAVMTSNLGPIAVPVIAGGDGGKPKNVYPNPPKSVAAAFGAAPADGDLVSQLASGHGPQALVNRAADGIARGDYSVAIVCGCESQHTLKRAIKEGVSVEQLGWRDDPGGKPVRLTSKGAGAPPQEAKHGLAVPVNTYPLFETALRGHLRRGVDEHSRAFSEMWAGMSRVAAAQPRHSWFPRAYSAEELRTPAGGVAGNRWVGTPYTKLHCSFLDVDQSAALLLMSAAEARRRGVPEAKLVYLHGAAEAVEKDTLLRPELHRAPALREAGAQAMQQARVRAGDVRHWEIYSCFPSAVQIAALELGADAGDGTRLTTTGGIPFHGGPGSNYSTHGIASMVERLREHPGDFGVVTANGGYLSKHAVGVYSTTPYGAQHPGAERWERAAPETYQSRLDAGPETELAAAPAGAGVLDTYTVAHAGDGRKRAIAIGRVSAGADAGRRFVAVSTDAATLSRLLPPNEGIGMRVHIATAGGRSTFTAAPAAAL